MTPEDMMQMAREIVENRIGPRLHHRVESWFKDKLFHFGQEIFERGRIAGLMKSAEICLYHKGKSAGLTEDYKAGCNEVYVSCMATANRIERGEYENPTSSVREAAQSSSAGGASEWPSLEELKEYIDKEFPYNIEDADDEKVTMGINAYTQLRRMEFKAGVAWLKQRMNQNEKGAV